MVDQFGKSESADVMDDALIPLTDSETIRITVVERNEVPSAVLPLQYFPPKSLQAEGPAGGEVRFELYALDADSPEQGLSFAVVDGPGQIVSFSPSPFGPYIVAQYYWRVPADTPMSTIDVTIRVTDSGSSPETFDAVVPVSIIRPAGAPYNAPMAAVDRYTVNHTILVRGDYSNGSLLANDAWTASWYNGNWYLGLPSDPGSTSIEVAQQPAHGTVEIDAGGRFTYTSNGTPFAGPETFSYRISHFGRSHTTTVNLE
jgi:hypothetical protein